MLFKVLDQSPHLASLGVESHLLWDMYHPIERSGWASHSVGGGEVKSGEQRALDWTINRITGGQRYLDKFPRNCLRVQFLNELYPDAMFVYITRDGRSAVSSMITAWQATGRFGAGTVLPVPLEIDGYEGKAWKFLVPPDWRDYARGHTLAEVCAFQWVSANRAVLDAREQIDPQRWTEVSYEALVADPTQQMSAILERVSLPPDGVMEWAADLDQHVSRTAVTSPRPNKWAEQHPSEISSVLPVLAPMMELLGYDSSPNPRAEF